MHSNPPRWPEGEHVHNERLGRVHVHVYRTETAPQRPNEPRPEDFPVLRTLDGHYWHAVLDGGPSAALALLDPDLDAHVLKILYRALAGCPQHPPSAADWKAARRAGVGLPPAPPALAPWAPESAVERLAPKPESRRLEALPDNALAVDPRLSQADAHNLAYAMGDGRLFRPCKEAQGYDWHLRLPTVVRVRPHITLEGKRSALADRAPISPLRRPEALDLELTLRQGQDAVTVRDLVVPTDFVLLQGTTPGTSGWLAAENCALTPEDVADRVAHAFFLPDPYDRTSPERQEEDFRRGMRLHAARAFGTYDETLAREAARDVKDRLPYLARSGKRIVIRIDGADVDVKIEASKRAPKETP